MQNKDNELLIIVAYIYIDIAMNQYCIELSVTCFDELYLYIMKGLGESSFFLVLRCKRPT